MLLFIISFYLITLTSLGYQLPHHEIMPRIVGGKQGRIEDFPYLAAILHRGVLRCGSTIINERTVITAAHCFKNVILEKLKVRVGSANSERYGNIIDVEDYIGHPKYSQLTQNYDLGIVWLKSKIDYSPTVKPIQFLPEQNEALPYGEKGIVAGWGRISEKGPFPEIFHYFNAPILQRKNCLKSGGGGYDSWRITDAMFCAGYIHGGKDACKSDSGGPFVIDNKLIGIVSFGQGCARPKTPGIYANVAYMREWIDQTILEKESGKNFNNKN